MNLTELKRLALQSTKLELDTAEAVRDESGKYSDCPMCGGEGTVDCENEFVNIDGVALGVQFYGIGKEFGYTEAYFRSVTPAAILELLEQRDQLLEALKGLIAVTKESRGVAGYHLNGQIADWDEFDFYDKAIDAIAAAEGE